MFLGKDWGKIFSEDVQGASDDCIWLVDKEHDSDTLAVGILLLVFFAPISLFLPVFYHPTVNLIAMPLFQCLLLLLFSLFIDDEEEDETTSSGIDAQQ